MAENKHLLRGTICALIGASLWGFSGACAQLLYENPAITPGYVTVVRAVLTALALGIFALCVYRKPFLGLLTHRQSRPVLWLYGLGLFGSQIAYAFSIEATNAGTATVLQSLFMVMVMVVSCIMARALPKFGELAGLVCALVGTWLIATGGDLAGLALPVQGLVWGIINAATVAVYVMVPKGLYAKWGSIPVIAAGMVLNAVFALVFWLVSSVPTGIALPSLSLKEVLVLVGGVSLVGTAGSYLLYLYGVSVVGPVRGSLLGAVEPVSAMLLAFLWLATPLTATDWVGAALMVLMIVLISLPSRKEKPAPNARE